MPHDDHGMNGRSLEGVLGSIEAPVARALAGALEGRDLSPEEAVTLLKTTGGEMEAVVLAADELRRRQVGEIVSYVVVRNINFTNVCIKHCGFCAFSRDHLEEEGYYLPIEEVVRRSREAWDLGVTEVCVQAGLPPHMDGEIYIRICEAIKAEVPDIHIHGFSPEEVLYGTIRSGRTVREYLKALKDAGLGSLPGTAAEVLDQAVRDRIAPGRITVQQWREVITTAHELGIPSSATMMYGHVETDEQKALHMALLRDIQRVTGGFTEFVPLSFVHAEAPMYRLGLVEGIRPGPTQEEVLKVHAVSRLMLNNHIPNLQASWVKLGPEFAQSLLHAGVNDLGGTLINESISTSAGAEYGQLLRPFEFRRLIRDAGRVPAERDTTYRSLRIFQDPASDPIDPLDLVEADAEERFGSYRKLAEAGDHRFLHPRYGNTETRA